MDAFILSPRPASGKDSSISDFKITPTLQHSSSRPAQFLTPVSPSTPAAPAIPALSAAPGPKASPSEILDSLRNNPTRESVVLSLALLDAKLDIRSPSPASSQITKVLLDSTVPDFWHVLSKSERRLLSRCLASPTGLGGIAAKLKTLIPPARDSPRPAAAAFRENLGNLLALLQLVLGRPGFVYGVWALAGKEQEIKRDLLWKEFAALVGGGRLLSLAAEADVALGRLSDGAKERWVGDGKLYALWLGREIAEACLLFALEDAASWKAVTLLLSAGFRLGYPDALVEGLTYKLISPDESARLRKLTTLLPTHDKRTYLLSLLRVISRRHLQDTSASEQPAKDKWWEKDSIIISGVSALLEKFILYDDDFRATILEWLTSTSGGGVGEPLALRRAIITVVAQDELTFRDLFEKALQHFADKLWIKHTPILRQEVTVQILLLCVGHSHRNSPSFLSRLTRSSNFMSGVSNRLAATSYRARFLGMLVGEVFSGLVDKEGIKMTFGTDDMDTPEAIWWKSIPSIEDKIGTLADLTTSTALVQPPKKPRQTPTIPSAKKSIQPMTKAPEDSDDSDTEFTPYALPDSDPEDSADEDASTIDRNAPTAPIYIRSLLTYLQTPDSYAHQHLALLHAAPLIRRKAALAGSKEVLDHLDELAAALAGIDDRFDMPDFSDLRQAALVALVATLPSRAAPWCAKQFFAGDYGLAQRAVLLVALGMGARELAALDPPPRTPAAPSLPPKVAAIWSGKAPQKSPKHLQLSEDATVASLAAQLQSTLLKPLRTRVFSSRMEVAQRTAAPAANPLASCVATAFVLPLTGYFQISGKDSAGRAPTSSSAVLLALFVDTLSIVVQAAGAGVPELREVAGEVLGVLLGLRRVAEREGRVCEAVLVGLLTVLEVLVGAWGGRRVADELGEEVGEAGDWVAGIWEGLEGEKKGAAAGVLRLVGEVGDGWRRGLFGGLGVQD